MIEKHATDLKTSLQLKKLGVQQKSIFYWYQRSVTKKWVLTGSEMEICSCTLEPNPNKKSNHSHIWDCGDLKTQAAAFTLSELIDMLGSGFQGMVQNPKNFENPSLPNWKAANMLLSVMETGNSSAKPGEWGHVAMVNGMLHAKAKGHSHIDVMAKLIIENIKKHKISFNKE